MPLLHSLSIPQWEFPQMGDTLRRKPVTNVRTPCGLTYAAKLRAISCAPQSATSIRIDDDRPHCRLLARLTISMVSRPRETTRIASKAHAANDSGAMRYASMKARKTTVDMAALPFSKVFGVAPARTKLGLVRAGGYFHFFFLSSFLVSSLYSVMILAVSLASFQHVASAISQIGISIRYLLSFDVLTP